jgi:hypothetical protein
MVDTQVIHKPVVDVDEHNIDQGVVDKQQGEPVRG